MLRLLRDPADELLQVLSLQEGQLSLFCDHGCTHSGSSRYDRATASLIFIIVCDGCGDEIRPVHVERYTPQFDPHGNDPYINQLGKAA